jgi:nucleoside-diphosphate-sugar epimerase
MALTSVRHRYLVAGGAGFIGSNLTKVLLDAGHSVDCIDNLVTGRHENIEPFLGRPGYRFIEGDITDSRACRAELSRRYTRIVNLACPTGVPNIKKLGEEMLLSSSVGVRNLLQIAERSKALYLFASTAEVYGDPEAFPQPESYSGNVDPTGPRSAYEEAKRFGEAMTVFYGRSLGVDVRIVRIFNTYGESMSPDDQRVIPQILSRLIRAEPVVIFGDGRQTRTFLHVDDLVAGLLRVMDRGRTCEVYNVGGSRQITITDLVRVAEQATGLQAKVVHTDHFIDDHRGRCPDTKKVEGLGWQQTIPLVEGIRRSYHDMLAALSPELVESTADELRDTAALLAQNWKPALVKTAAAV